MFVHCAYMATKPKSHAGADGRFGGRIPPLEKEAFEQAAELAGLSLTVWIRQRCRTAATAELQAAGQPVPFLAGRTTKLR